MIRVSVLYPRKEGARFDWAYYLNSHIPMVGRKFGTAAQATTIEQGLGGGGPGQPAPFVAIVHFTFESVPAFQAAFGPHAAEIMADIPNYTSIEPLVQISEIKVER
ncbi:MAG: EthD family reductase [Opitutaceae bacterium]|jgi:uncharacterized protein (TIGR02118 family)